MFDVLLPAYEEELQALRRLGAEFARSYPAIAGRLRLVGESVEDPHVERLLEGVAFLNARIRRRLDDEFPELVDTLLGVLQPQLLAPIPSLCLARFEPAADAQGPADLAAGSGLEAELAPGETWRFRTVYPVTLWPVRLAEARLLPRPFEAPPCRAGTEAVAALRLSFTCLAESMTFAQLAPDTLRLHLVSPLPRALRLYELLLNDTLAVAVAQGVGDPAPLLLGPEALAPVGFARADALLPEDARSFPGYRLLSEYFAIPEKFLFVDLTGIGAKTASVNASRIEVFLYLRRLPDGLERAVDAGSFALHTAPAVNLFPQPAEPLRIDNGRAEYRVVPDARRPQAFEVWAVTGARASLPDGARLPLRAFFAPQLAGGSAPFWHTIRRPAPGDAAGGEVHIAFTDHEDRPALPDAAEVSLDTLCMNRDLPQRITRGETGPRLRLTPARGEVARVDCLLGPTPVLRRHERRGTRPKLLAQLALNHLSLANGEAGAAALRELLRLHDRKDTAESRAVIDAILRLTGRPATARAPIPDLAAFCRGLDLTLELAAKPFAGSSPFLLASVLERFLALHANVNAFTRLTTRLGGEELRRWPARAGERPLL